MRKLFNKKIYFTLAFGVMFLPFPILASTVYIDTNHTSFYLGDTILFNVRIDSEGKNINAVEGEVLLDHAVNAASLKDINTSGSTFSLWPSKPLPSERNMHISFAGGSPGGFVSKEEIIFNIVLKLQKVGQIALSPNDIGVYLNNGKGTKDEVRVKNLVIDVLPKKSDSQPVDDWSNIISDDTTPPEPFEIYLGQDESVFDGKKFLSFSTDDRQSGIAYYEVIENDLSPVQSNGTYVLREQNLPVKVTVIAYDSAGNTKESVYDSAPYKVLYIIVVILIVSIILLIIIFKKRRKLNNGFIKK